MLQFIKKHLPVPIKKALIAVKQKTYDQWQKKRLFNRMQLKHAELLQQIKGKEKIKVVFLAIHKSVWKVDPVFQKMLEDPFFEPEILVCPYTPYGEERMLEDMEQAYAYFLEKGYPVRKSRNEDGSWTKLEELKPDLAFFTNPHNLTRKEYYEDAYLNYLSCYVPYFLLTTTHGNDQSIYNQHFHNAMWKIFMPHHYGVERAALVSASNARNCILTGYPSCEAFVSQNKNSKSVWKEQHGKKKIIFSPHHTISEGELELSNFIVIADLMLDLVEKYKDKIQWSFKPHPILKSKLYMHPHWGNDKTDSYYRFWESYEYTQLDEGEYIDLFIQSDSIIHDCGSFIAEYPFVGKPCAYLQLKGNTQIKSINQFGRYALESYEIIKSENDLINFIESIINNKIKTKPSHSQYIENYISPLYVDSVPSEKILRVLRYFIKGESKK
ncbi:hypothetical protein FXF61_09705 [Pseudomonas sp. C27(2019)]|uniref:hypothetical protein n=1 Tax=Pseudomonas sp. C27(2019) TaxID=2604941 RepID=UPI001245A2D2|nr:hypothetical protein [Pseudomonas sp. C27(2019)]QEY59415.1 hypothetical protein FXF61_09705 [Pseudomonas sp. C27(2019)]